MLKKLNAVFAFLLNYLLLLNFSFLFSIQTSKATENNYEIIARQQSDSANKYFSIDLDIAEQYAQSAILYSLNTDNYQLILESYQLKAKILKYSYKNTEALENIYKAYLYSIVSRNVSKIIELTIEITDIMRSIGKLNIALEYLYNLEEILSKNDKLNLAKINNRLAAIYYELNRYEYAIEYAQTSNEFINKNTYPLLYADNKIIIGASYSRLFKNDEALENILSVKDIFEKYSPIDLPYVLFNICQAYSAKGDYKNAIKYGEMSFEMAKKMKIEAYMQTAALYLIRAYLRARDVENSLKYLKISDSLSMKLNTMTQLQKVTDDENRIKLKQKENTISEYKQTIYRNNKINTLIRWIVIILISTVVITVIYLTNSIKKSKELKKLNNEISSQQEELIKYANELQVANDTKNTFFSIISHDLRSPFHSILGLTDVLIVDNDQLSDEEKLSITKMLNDSAQKVYRLLDNLLKWAQTQTGSIKFNPELFNVTELINEIINLSQSNASDKKITIEFNETSSFNVFADRNMIDTVIRNVLSNSIKFSNSDSVISVNLNKTDNILNLSVKDNGIGISEDDLSKIFNINQKHIRTGTGGETGSGLGLLLCKEFVEKNNGKIFIESTLNIGTTVNIQLPLEEKK